METVLVIISVLSILAFIVGMIKPSVVKCKSRGIVTLIYLGSFLIASIIGGSIMDNNSPTTKQSHNEVKGTKSKYNGNENIDKPSPSEEENSRTKKEVPKIPDLMPGSDFILKHGNGEVEFTFENLQIKRIPNEGRNLIITVKIKNNSNNKFFISDSGWKLLDSENIEVEESGIYEPVFSDFAPGTFLFTIVEPNVGKKEKVGYSVNKEPYYLSIDGKIVGRVNIDN